MFEKKEKVKIRYVKQFGDSEHIRTEISKVFSEKDITTVESIYNYAVEKGMVFVKFPNYVKIESLKGYDLLRGIILIDE